MSKMTGRRMAAMLAMLAAAWLAGCRAPASPQGQAQLARAREQFGQEQYAVAAQTLSTFLVQEGSSKEAAEAYYLRGLSYMEMSPPRDVEAEVDFLKAKKLARDKHLEALANVGLGHIYYETRSGQLDEAIEHYQQALELLPAEGPRDVVLVRLGSALQKLGRWTQADLYFSRCLEEFSQSAFAQYARERFGARAWVLQFGALSSLERAQELIGQVSQGGMVASWTPVRQNGSVLYAVQAGSYETYALAEQTQRELTGRFPEVIVVAAGRSPQ